MTKLLIVLLFFLTALKLTVACFCRTGGIRNPRYCSLDYIALINITRAEDVPTYKTTINHLGKPERTISQFTRHLYFTLESELTAIGGMAKRSIANATFIINAYPYPDMTSCDRKYSTGLVILGGHFAANAQAPTASQGCSAYSVYLNPSKTWNEQLSLMSRIERECQNYTASVCNRPPDWCYAEFFAIINITRTEDDEVDSDGGGLRRLYFHLKEEFLHFFGYDRRTLSNVTFINNLLSGMKHEQKLSTGSYLVGGNFNRSTQEPFLLGTSDGATYTKSLADLRHDELTSPLEMLNRTCTECSVNFEALVDN